MGEMEIVGRYGRAARGRIEKIGRRKESGKNLQLESREMKEMEKDRKEGADIGKNLLLAYHH